MLDMNSAERREARAALFEMAQHRLLATDLRMRIQSHSWLCSNGLRSTQLADDQLRCKEIATPKPPTVLAADCTVVVGRGDQGAREVGEGINAVCH